MRKIEVSLAKADLARLVEDVADGEEIVLASDGKPVARLVPFEPRRERRKPGLTEGKIWIADDCDGPLAEEIMTAFCAGRP